MNGIRYLMIVVVGHLEDHMFVTKSERFQELQSALALREQEVSQLVARKAELLDQQRSARINNGRSASSHASSEDPAAMFTIDHPVFAWCNGADAVWDLPVEQIGNVIAQLDAGIASLRLKTRNAVRESEHIAHRQRVIGSQEEKLEVAIKVLAESTGLPTNSSNQQGVQTKRLQSAPVGAFLRPDNEDAPTVRKLIVRATKESRLAESVHHATLKTIDQLNKTISKQDDTHQKINETRNRIRCAERDLEGKKRLLEDLLVEHETLDKQLSIAMRPTSDHRTRLILDRDVADLKRQVEDCVEGERRVQDRVIKAQEYRILQLEKRLVSVKRALQFHTLTDKVEAAILHLMSDATHSNNAAEDVDLGNRETLYDIDRIVPPQELVHPALYSLLASEKDKLAVVVSQQEAVIREKDQNVDALALEVASLTLGLDEAQTLLDMTTSQIALEEDEQRDAVVDDVLRQRQHYKQLLADKCHLRRDMIQQWSERHSKKDGTPSSRSSLSPHPAGDEHSECDKSPRSAPLERELSTRRSSSNRVRFVDPHDEASDEPQTNALCETQRPESTA